MFDCNHIPHRAGRSRVFQSLTFLQAYSTPGTDALLWFQRFVSMNFFNHAYKELSHGAVLAYSLAAFQESRDSERSSAAVFGQALADTCFPNHLPISPHEVDVHRESAIGDTSHQPDFCLELTRDGERYASIIETKYRAPSSVSQLEVYADALSEAHDARFEQAVLYKSTPSYTIPRRSNFVFLGPHEIERLLRDAQEGEAASWIVEEYHRWLRQTVRRDELFAEPAFQDWYLSAESERPAALEAYADVWPGTDARNSSRARRRVYWHIARHAGRQLDDLPDDQVGQYVHSDGNANSDSAWVHLKVADVEADFGGSIFYRLDRRKHGLGFELRLYAGPKRGTNHPEAKQNWENAKKDLLANMKAELQAAGLDNLVDVPGYREYAFQKGSKETSIACLWLVHHGDVPPWGEGLTPSQVYDAFPAVHECTRRAVEATDPLRPKVEWVRDSGEA